MDDELIGLLRPTEAELAPAQSPHLSALLDKTGVCVRRYVVLGPHELIATALWNAHTYTYECARATPYLHATSPEPGSGKTTFLDVLEMTACDALQVDGLSEAALFRLIAKVKPTLLFDEVDAVFGKRNSDSAEGIRQVLNSGYRLGKRVWRCVPPSHDVEPFDVYCPKALAGLNALPGTLAHRAIQIAMKPPLPTDDYVEFDPEDFEEEANILRSCLRSWADASQDALRDPRLKPVRLGGLDARGNEIWRILLRIADLAGGEWPQRARDAALALSGRDRRHQDASTGVRLLAHVRGLFAEERMSCSALVQALNEDDALPYGSWSDGKGMTTRELGRRLQPYGIRAKTVRIGDRFRGNGYERHQFEDAWGRYLAESDSSYRDSVTTLYSSQESPETNHDDTHSVTVSEGGAPA